MTLTKWVNAAAAAAVVGLLLSHVAAETNGQTFSVPLVADTVIIDNDGAGADTEDNFGGREELFSGSFVSGDTGLVATRSILLRFDVSSIATQINDPTLTVTGATLSLNAGGTTAADSRAGLNDAAAGVVLDVFGLVPENNGWIEGTSPFSTSLIDSGEFGSVSARFLATPSVFSNTLNPNSVLPEPDGLGLDDETDLLSGPGIISDGLLWFSQGGGPSGGPDPENDPQDPDTFFDIAGDTTNASLTTTEGLAIPASFGTNDGDLSFSLSSGLDPFLAQWLAAPVVADANGDMETSNAGLVITQIDGPNSQVFFASLESNNDDGANPPATLEITFGAAALAGDYDQDGDVDTDDYSAWAANFGESGPFVVGPGEINPDGNSDGIVDAADYTIWRDNLGAGSAVAVPEPTSTGLLGLSLLMMTGRASRKRGG